MSGYFVALDMTDRVGQGEAKEARSCIDILSAYATGPKALAVRVALGVVTKEEAREAKKKASAAAKK